jgi:hypothetical protein
LVLQNSWGLGVELTTPPCKTVTVTKPSKKEGRPKPTPGCSAEEEEEEESPVLNCFQLWITPSFDFSSIALKI